jgi:hypothetical protein
MRQQIHGKTAPDVSQLCQLMTPQMPVQQHAMHEQRDRSPALIRVADSARCGLHALPGGRWFVSIHGSASPRRCRGNMRFLQLLRAPVTAHLNGLAANPDRNRIYVELAVASRASSPNHDHALPYPKSGYD